MSASLKPIWSIDEFLAWERLQQERYEFDGVQPIGLVGGSLRHSAVATALVEALRRRLRPPCRAFRGDVKVLTAPGRIRYPDAVVTCTEDLPEDSDVVPRPVVVFEVLSPSTAAFDRTVQAHEYAATDSIQAYVMLEQDRPAATVLRRSTGWQAEAVEGAEAILVLPEVGLAALPLAVLAAG
jgi:Uma2 family endonuclease